MSKPLSAIHFAFLIGLFLFSGQSSARQVCRSVLEQLAFFAYETDTSRSEHTGRISRRYKTDEKFAAFVHQDLGVASFEEVEHRFQALTKDERARLIWIPRTYDLNDGKCTQACPSLATLKHARSYVIHDPMVGRYRIALSGAGTIYETALLLMREGDTAQLPSKAFTLGPFLGSGNCSHVWGIKERDDAVLKLPFSSALAATVAGPSEENIDFIARSRERMKWLVQTRPVATRLRVLKILEYGPNFEYVLMEKVPDAQDGRSFLRQHADLLARFEAGPVGGLNREHTGILAQYEQLKAAVAHAAEIGANIFSRRSSNLQIPARQFLWDKRTGEWVFADW